MRTGVHEAPASTTPRIRALPNGGAMAAFLAAGIGSFAMGLILVLGAVGVLSIPAIYEPAGGVTGRTTLAVVVWLISWVMLHARWKNREIQPARVGALTLLLTTLGILGTFPPIWALMS